MRTKRLLGAICAHVELTQRSKGVTAQLAENECGIPVFECVPLIGQWKETSLARDFEATQMHWTNPGRELAQLSVAKLIEWLMMRVSNER